MYYNGGTYKKCKDKAPSFTKGPSCSIPVQIPTRNLILQANKIYTGFADNPLLVNTHNTYNGNPGKQYLRQKAWTFTKIILCLLKVRDNNDYVPTTLNNKSKRIMTQYDCSLSYLDLTCLKWSVISYITKSIMFTLTYIWSKLNLVICNLDGGKIIEKAKVSSNFENYEIYKPNYHGSRKTHPVRNSLIRPTGLNSRMLGNTSKITIVKRKLSTGQKQDLPFKPKSAPKTAKLLDWESLN
jgi:hypothetical protein